MQAIGIWLHAASSEVLPGDGRRDMCALGIAHFAEMYVIVKKVELRVWENGC